jgi:hypothetical protein
VAAFSLRADSVRLQQLPALRGVERAKANQQGEIKVAAGQCLPASERPKLVPTSVPVPQSPQEDFLPPPEIAVGQHVGRDK